MSTIKIRTENYATLQNNLARRVQQVLWRPSRRATASITGVVTKKLGGDQAALDKKSVQLLSGLGQSLSTEIDWPKKQEQFRISTEFWRSHFPATNRSDPFALEPYKELLLSCHFTQSARSADLDTIDYLLIAAFSRSFIYPGPETLSRLYSRTAAWLAANDSPFFGPALAPRLSLYAKLLDDFANLLALGHDLPKISQGKIPFPFVDRPVIVSDCFCGGILPLFALPELAESAGLVFGVPFMSPASVFARGNKIFIRRGLIKQANGELLLSEFSPPARADYFYPFAPDWELNDFVKSRVPMPGDFSGVRLVEEAPLGELLPPELTGKTPETLIEVYRTIPSHPFFVARQKSLIADRLRYAFSWLGTEKVFLKPVNSLYGIGAFGFLEREEIDSPRFWQAVNHIFNCLASYDHGNDDQGRPKIDFPPYWGFQIQAALDPIKVFWQGEEHSHKIRALAALTPTGHYLFAGALAYLGKGDVVGGFNAEPFSLAELAMMIGLNEGPNFLEKAISSLVVPTAEALVKYAQEDRSARTVIGEPKIFLGNPDFFGYQMDWLGFDLVVERSGTKGTLELKIIEVNDWRSSGALELMIDLQGENPLRLLAPIILRKASNHFQWRKNSPFASWAKEKDPA